MFTVTRQIRWPDGLRIVEISQGSYDLVNPDALVKKYAGEGEEYVSPVEAVEVAISIAQQWQTQTKETVYLAMGATHGHTAVFDEEPLTEETFAALRATAEEIEEGMPRCDRCGDLLGKDYVKIRDGGACDGGNYCSESCASNAIEEAEADMAADWDDSEDPDWDEEE